MMREQLSDRQPDCPGAGYPARVLEEAKGSEGFSGPLVLQGEGLQEPPRTGLGVGMECQKLVEEAGQ